MQKLADISSFLSIQPAPVQSAMAVFNRLVWEEPVDEAIMRYDWATFESLARGASDEIDALLDEIIDLNLCGEFLDGENELDGVRFGNQYDERDNNGPLSPGEKSWWDLFQEADKKPYWDWLARERRIQEKEESRHRVRDEFINDEQYEEFKRQSLMETGRFDEE